jgi:hypothetical protein
MIACDGPQMAASVHIDGPDELVENTEAICKKGREDVRWACRRLYGSSSQFCAVSGAHEVFVVALTVFAITAAPHTPCGLGDSTT